MRHTTLLLLMASLVTSPAPARADGPPAARGDAAYARPLHKLTEVEARRLNVKCGLWFVRVEEHTTHCDGEVTCWCQSSVGGPRRAAIMCLRPGQKPAKAMTVEATLFIYRRPPILGRPATSVSILLEAVRR